MQETVVYLKKITQPEAEKKELERELSQCGWELFRMGMKEQYGLDGEKITIERNAHGKPYLPGHPQICFNISHSGNTLPALLLPFRSAWICSSTAALPGSAWQNGIFPPKTRNALPQWRMLKRCFSGSGPRRRATASGGEPVFRVLLERKRKRASACISVRRKDMKAPSGQRSP